MAVEHDALGPMFCAECNYEGPGPLSWNAHVTAHHDGVDPRLPRWTCLSPWCSITFLELDEMAAHISEKHYPRVLLPLDFDLDVLAQEAQAQLAFHDYLKRTGRE